MGIDLLVSLLILALVVVILFFVIDILGLPGKVAMIAKLIIGLVVLLHILKTVLPMLHI